MFRMVTSSVGKEGYTYAGLEIVEGLLWDRKDGDRRNGSDIELLGDGTIVLRPQQQLQSWRKEIEREITIDVGEDSDSKSNDILEVCDAYKEIKDDIDIFKDRRMNVYQTSQLTEGNEMSMPSTLEPKKLK
ncbi:hypothetical protein DSO57_1006655 [Entomophthora muscae]|uniref:Uncharacterized protein n=2 Tax=Entomophthora muscae TaxID=34485 RepID=A0ACC2SND5_9FUNG|nr:hypothetical protein DSO57_1037387 [Entomophthora muscae]KAJ9066728.1 hypothetical protein DSO57_1006655 [Entomophthora muscae]